MTYFHHQTIRRYTSALLDLFNDIHIVTYDETDPSVVTRDTIVPIKFASTQKAFQLEESEYQRLQSSDYNVLPRFSLAINSLSKTPEKQTNKQNKVEVENFVDANNKSMKWTYNSVVYDLGFDLNIIARTFTDLTIIIEQILPMFNPTYPLKIKDLTFHDKYRTVPIKLEGVEMDLDVDLAIDDNIRFVNATLSFSISTNIYPPIKEHVNVNLHSN